MSRKLLLILGHPSTDSYCAALADAYAEGARAGGAEVERLNLGEIAFDPVLRQGYQGEQSLEAGLAQAHSLLTWADHMVFVYPTWWGGAPALLSGFIERVFLPGFAFRYRSESPMPERLLLGKTARLVVTMDSPPWYYRWIMGAPGHRAMQKAILEFCGVKLRGVTEVGPVRNSSSQRRVQWLATVRQLGERLA